MNFPAKRESLDNSQAATDVLCQILWQKAAAEVGMEVFDDDFLDFNYFVSIFWEFGGTKLEDPKGRLIWLMQYTSGKAKDLVKNCIYLPSEVEDRETMRIRHKGYGDPHKILAAYRKEIKEWPAVTAGDAAGFARFFNFLVKCKSLLVENKTNNLINNPDIICRLSSKFPTYLQVR